MPYYYRLAVKLFLFPWLLLIPFGSVCLSQSSPFPTYPGSENFIEQPADETNETDEFLNDLTFFLKHPINLNKTTKDELQALHILTDLQICQLFTHIEKNGNLMLIYELQAIEGFDLPTIQKLLPYVHVSDQSTPGIFNRKEWLKGEHSFVLRYAQVLEKQSGFRDIDSLSLFKNPNSRYVGSPQKFYAQYRYTCKRNISFGITAEKDPGELFFKQNNRIGYTWHQQQISQKLKTGFDFYSAHLFFSDIRYIKVLAMGDYVLTFGQGLTLWNGISFGKTTDMLYVKKNAAGIRPSTSADENRYMRGIAGSIQLKRFVISFFYSRKKTDAHVHDISEKENPAGTFSLQQTGLHGTLREITAKHSMNQTNYGGNITFTKKRWSAGLTLLDQQFGVPIQSATFLNSSSETKINHSFHAGIDYQFLLRNFTFFGEYSHQIKTGRALLNGCFIVLDPRLSLTILHRYYPSDYTNPSGAGFSEGGNSNEKGLYLGLAAHVIPGVQLNIYLDRFSFFRPLYQTDAPSQGNDLNFQCSYTPSKKWNAIIRFHQSHKEKNTQQQLPVKKLAPWDRYGYRIQLNYHLSTTLQLRNRIEFLRNRFENAQENAYLIYQDIFYHKPGKPLAITLRYALFETGGYESRLYAYENDLPGSYSVPALSDRGARFYVLFNYSLTKHFEIWLRYARTTYDNKDVISEGTLTEILGNTKSEVKAQLKLKF